MIYKIFEHLNKEFNVLEVLPKKDTARCPLSIIVEVEGAKKYVVIGSSPIQKFYIKRSIEKQKEFYEDYSKYYKFNFPEIYGDLEDFTYAIYPYIENLQWTIDDRPIIILNQLYKEKAKVYTMDKELLTKIQEDFLSAWPQEFHERIKQSDIYKKYFDKIGNIKEVKIYKEHCDYTINNILTDGKDLYLTDFEFARSFQIAGFDEYDYKRTQSTINIKNNDISSLKVDLIDYVNNVIDQNYKPKVEILIEDKEKYAEKVYPNFIYNRFDLRFGKDFNIFKIEENNKTFYIPYHIERKLAVLGTWLTPISYCALDMVIQQIFKLHKKVERIQIRYSLNAYDGLKTSNHWCVNLPDNIEKFDKLLSTKTRYNTKWYPKKIKEELGDYEVEKLSLDDITEDLVNKYFEFKYETHQQQYDMTPKEYLKNYYVNYAYILKINNNIQAILFDCNLDKISYLENFAYNPNLSKYSLGMVIYHYYINDLIQNGVREIYLGDGMQEYKRRFNGVNHLVFDGYVTKQQNSFLDKIKRLFGRKRS